LSSEPVAARKPQTSSQPTKPPGQE
jgi:hypothetical protein